MPVRERYETPQATDGEQRLCSRGTWCSDPRLTRTDNGTMTREPALGYRAFCDRDWNLIRTCITELPAIFGRLQAEIGCPAATETSIHVPFGPSVPLRMDIDAAMRVTAWLLRSWEGRVMTTVRISHRAGRLHTADSVTRAARTLEKHISTLLALQPGWMTQNVSLPSGRGAGAATQGTEATCRRCGRHISRSGASGRWWGAYRSSTDGLASCGHGQEHEPQDGTVIQPSLALIPAHIEDELGDSEIVRFGADFLGLFVQRDGAAAGLEILHLHYWNRAVLRETLPRPEELLGVECRACSEMALRRAEPPWHKDDPGFYSECASCGHMMTEDEYHTWTGQLAAYQRARRAAMPVLAAAPAS